MISQNKSNITENNNVKHTVAKSFQIILNNYILYRLLMTCLSFFIITLIIFIISMYLLYESNYLYTTPY